MSTTRISSDPEMESSSFSDRVSDTVEQTKNKITEFGSATADKFEQNRVAMASGLEGAAESLHERADQLPGGPKVANLAHTAADKLNTTADFVRQHDLNRMMSDVEDVVKRNPGPSLLVAAGLGFLVARAISSGSRG